MISYNKTFEHTHRSSPLLNLMVTRIEYRVKITRRQTSTAVMTARIMVSVSDDATGLHGSIYSKINELYEIPIVWTSNV